MPQMMTANRLRQIYGPPGERAAAKVIDRLDHHCRAFIAAAPFMVLGTSDGQRLDLSPKGDPAGFVAVEDDHHLLIPDRLGNNRIDGLLNIIAHPHVALLFLIPTVTETLRINGTATIHEDAALCARFAVQGRAPLTVLRIAVEEVFTHCGKAPIRGGIWQPETWPAARPVATLGAMITDHAKIAMDTSQAATDALYKQTLY
jgi:PPOX class probable FMN-dependent enzyme